MKYAILRIDDVGREKYSEIVRRMTEDLLKRKIPCVLGVIACELENTSNYIVPLKSNKDIEFALHGYYHKEDDGGKAEFENLSLSDARKLVLKGKKIMKEKLGATPITFIPPWNLASEETKEALVKEGFKVFSGSRNEFEKSKLVSIGFNAHTSTFNPHTLVSLEKVIGDCIRSFEERDYCVVMVHPQDYLEDGWGDRDKPPIDKNKYKQFTGMLDYLKKIDAHFVTFKELHGAF